MSRIVAAALAVLSVLAVAVAAGRAGAAVVRPLRIVATAKQPGWISFRIFGTPGANVAISEETASGSTPIASLHLRYPSSGRHNAVAWRCDVLERHFVATATLPGGGVQTASTQITTRSCANRLVLSLWPSPARLGHPVAVQVNDRWGVGDVPLSVCVTSPSRQQRCSTTKLAAGAQAAATRFIASRMGDWSVAVQAPSVQLHATTTVVRGGLRLLATGDSEIQTLDDMIVSALRGRVSVTSEAHISTGISKLAMFNWVGRAQAQAQGEHPDVTVMFIGANDGFPVPDPAGRVVNCCGAGWVKGYAARVQQMMSSYLRHGAGRVYWFTLPTPSQGDLARYFRAINAAFVMAASRFPYGVHLMDIRPVFTPGGRFRSSMYWQGRYVTVREPDGYHLSVGGDRIALTLLLRAMHADGVL